MASLFVDVAAGWLRESNRRWTMSMIVMNHVQLNSTEVDHR